MYAFARFCYIVVRIRAYVILLTVGWYSLACMQAKSICISTYIYDGIKGIKTREFLKDFFVPEISQLIQK